MFSIKRTVLAGAAFVGASILSSIASAQQTAYTTNDLNLREGPGTEFRATAIIPRGAEVNITYCSNSESWCYVAFQQHVGWASSRYLTTTSQFAQAPQQSQTYYPPPEQYQLPQQQTPVYQPPQQQVPVYQPPQQQAPVYQPPQYEPPQNQHPPPPAVVTPYLAPHAYAPPPHYWPQSRFRLWLGFWFH